MVWLKNYGIRVGETLRVRLENIYRNRNGKPICEAVVLADDTRIQFNVKEDDIGLSPGVYELTCNNKSDNGYPFVELHVLEEFEPPNESIDDLVNDIINTQNDGIDKATITTLIAKEIEDTEEKLKILKALWKMIT